MKSHHPLEDIEIKGDRKEEVRELLKLLPENTFSFVEDFQDSPSQYCGQMGIYAKKEPLLGERGIMLVIVDEHLFGDPTRSEYNPTLRIPDEAKNINVIPPRQPPLKKNHPFAGTQFSYREANFFFGFELSDEAYSTITESIKNKK